MPYSLEDFGFEVLTAVTMKNRFFWDLKPCNLKKGAMFWRMISPPSSGSFASQEPHITVYRTDIVKSKRA
jgi:hypothetical protein